MIAVQSVAWNSAPANENPIEHPTGMIKQADLDRAKENLKHHAWARQYLKTLRDRVDPWISKITPEFLDDFIPETTPGDKLFTPCPACRDQEKAYLPHGNWHWSPESPNELHCKVCEVEFPNENYPETVEVRTSWGKPQVFTFMGGEPFPVFSFPTGRPSISGNIRAQKAAWITTLVRDIAEVTALTAEEKYAKATKEILLRFAAVYPHWLVHSGYGEYADMDPAVAAENINSLPQDESVYPPNTPDGKLHTGYWSAGRAGAMGMEGIFVRSVTTAYDLTRSAEAARGQPLYTPEEKNLIENDLLKESVALLLADKQINNKSMTNRSAVGLVGLVTEDPDFVRFGIEGFSRTVDEWFLPDGGTPESQAYSLMALGGVVDFAQALRGYTDPENYKDDEGVRYDQFDPYRDTNYERIWRGMFLTLQGDLFYPAFADSYVTTRLDAHLAELMAANYPEIPEYAALLKETLDGDWSKTYAPYAIYYADPDREEKSAQTLSIPSHVFADLKLGFLRTGDDGRESLLLLSASEWGTHHHLDSLNLYFWKKGQELLSDLGYLWDHPDREKTVRTFAHNTVLIDTRDQITQGRGGEVRYFVDTPNVKAMRATSQAYPEAKMYERAVTLVDHGDGQNYVVDIFWVEGGTMQDYVYHGPNANWELVQAFDDGKKPSLLKNDQAPMGGSRKSPLTTELKPGEETIYDLTDLQVVENPDDTHHAFRWRLSSDRVLSVWHLPQEGEKIFIGEGWGQRDFRNADRGASLPYVVRRTEGKDRKAFISLFEEHADGRSLIEGIIPMKPDESMATALQIKTSAGNDYVVLNSQPGEVSVPTPDGLLKTDASLAVLSVQKGEVRFSAVDSGSVQLVAGQ